MKIKTVKSSNVKGYLTLGILGESGYLSFLISEAQYITLGSPSQGDSLSEESFSSLLDFSEYNKAKRKALGILSYGDNSSSSLIMKLRRAGFSRELSERISEEMQSLGYIDEERQLLRLVACEVERKLSGPRRTLARLAAKGYRPEKIRAAIKKLSDEGEISFERVREALIKSLPEGSSYDEIKKILYKHGF